MNVWNGKRGGMKLMTIQTNKMKFRDVKTGAYFKYRGETYIKCANSYDKYDTEFNTWLADKWPLKSGERFFRNETDVNI